MEELALQNIAYAPFFPLGGFTPLQSSALDAAAAFKDDANAGRACLAASARA
jgi:hypothetical protein